MADLVNPTSAQQLSPKNGEASNLKGGSFATLGGPTWDNKGGPDAYKIDASQGVNADTTIPKATGSEPTHLKTEEDDAPDVDFGDGDNDVDDLDRSLDEFDSSDEVDVDVTDDDDDDEDKPVSESVVAEEDEIVIKKDDKDDDKKDDDEKKDDIKEGLPPWLKGKGKNKKKLKEEDDDEKVHIDVVDGDHGDKEVKEEDEIVIKKDDKDDDKKDVKAEAFKVRIKMPDVKLFESVNMSAKTQKKVGVVFEAAIRDTTKQISKQLAAHYKKLHEAKIAERDAVMAKQMDAYLSYVVEEYVKSNRVAIRQSLRSQLAEEFLTGLQKLFKEHYIDVPESKVDVVAKLSEENAKLRRGLNEEHAKKIKLHKLAEAANKARIVAESARGLSEVSAAKLMKLAENTPYVSAKDFREKVGLLRESYMESKAEDKQLNRLGEDDVQEQVVVSKSTRVSDDATVDAAAKALSTQATSDKW